MSDSLDVTHKVDEDTFNHLLRAGALKYVTVDVREEGKSYIHFKLANGEEGLVHTKRGQPKSYRIQTVLTHLRGLGITSLTVDMVLYTSQSILL